MAADRSKHYRIGSYILVGFAVLLFVAVLFADPRRMESPTLMLSASSFIAGVFLFALDGDASIDARLASRLSLQGISALGGIIRDLGGSGAAVFLPPDGDGGKVMQFIPTQPAFRSVLGDGGGFACHDGSTGTLSRPLAAPILEDLKSSDALVLPSEFGPLMGAVREVCEDLLSVADRVTVKRESDTVLVSLHNYLLYPGCASLRETSPEFCMLSPCSICSLIACMIAEGLACEVSLAGVTLDDAAGSRRMEIRYALKECAGAGEP
ncbi:hypothetical protein F8E02_06515 [Methanoculleus sp. Wushi-C6]|uniref:DUF7982 domain-containing protein n=1 Tax=Methanoculleus caldifontis TaxID=2651577 RepID=A0ABU3X0T0_9EURY|nr:hypothetical protein [Methanoculleus sp. Wushi-C6]MDV2481662.1 hypothetical protein [Methanoculleus sp. Wushi-C6]